MVFDAMRFAWLITHKKLILIENRASEASEENNLIFQTNVINFTYPAIYFNMNSAYAYDLLLLWHTGHTTYQGSAYRIPKKKKKKKRTESGVPERGVGIAFLMTFRQGKLKFEWQTKIFELQGVINKFENVEYAATPNKHQNFL